MFAHTLLAAVLAGSAAAAKMCVNTTIPVTISSRNGVFDNIATPVDALGATTFFQNETRQGTNFTATALSGYATVSGTYNISAMYCAPRRKNSTVTTPTLQILTHGIGFDKTYWNLAYDNFNYSYVDIATDAGYATLAIDRLGIGNSTHGEPKNEIQAFLEVAALAAVTQKARNGTIPMVNSTYSRVVHVGHSFGSGQTYALADMYPTLTDGIILTGFSLNSSFLSYFSAGGDFQQAALNQPLRFGNASIKAAYNMLVENFALTDLFAQPNYAAPQVPLAYPAGYFTHSNVNALQYLFLYSGSFDPQIAYYGEAGKQPVTVGEILTLGSIPTTNKFSGPVLIVTGQYDLPFCGGDCLATGGAGASIPAAAKMAFTKASAFDVLIQPKTGHGLNFHYNATAGYNYIQSFLATNLKSTGGAAMNGTVNGTAIRRF